MSSNKGSDTFKQLELLARYDMNTFILLNRFRSNNTATFKRSVDGRPLQTTQTILIDFDEIFMVPYEVQQWFPITVKSAESVEWELIRFFFRNYNKRLLVIDMNGQL